MNTIKAKKLNQGDCIGIVSISAPEAYNEKERFYHGVNYLSKKGFEVVIGDHVMETKGYITANPRIMAEDLMKLFANKKVRCIICAGGGTNSNSLLQYIDFNVINQNPKIFMGVSNPTTLLNAINTMTGLITFHGPSVVWDLGEKNGVSKFTENYMWTELRDGNKEHYICDNDHKWESLRNGISTGILVGGNLSSLQVLLGTKYEPEWDGKILFWEDICKPIDRIDSILTHFKDVGVFKRISGMIIGELVSCDPGNKEINEMVLEKLSEYSFPIIANVPFGHTSDKLTLPVGAKATIDTNKMNTIKIEESSVVEE